MSGGEMRVAVLGAGIVGMTTTLELLSAFPSWEVTLIADKFKEETLSNGAAGIFRPGTSFAGPTPGITKRWLIDSYNYYNNLIGQAGISRTTGYIFSSTSPDIVKNQFLEGLVPVYRPATKEELASCPGDWLYGSYFETLLIQCHIFLPWALKKVEEAGVKVIQKRIDSFDQLAGDYDVVINCMGLGAKQLTGDHMLVPLRGTTIKVDAPWLKHFYYADYDTYIIPLSDGRVVLGGSRLYDSYSLDVCPHEVDAIWERCVALIPRLAEAKILSKWVGLRPHRSSVRVEPETIGTLKVIHNYGHGGYGVTSAPGSAKYVVELLKTTVFGSCKL